MKERKSSCLSLIPWDNCDRMMINKLLAWCDASDVRAGRGREAGAGAASHDWRKMSSYGNNHWVLHWVTLSYTNNLNNLIRRGKCCLMGPGALFQVLNKVSKIKLEHKIGPNYVFWAPYLLDAGALIIITLKQTIFKIKYFSGEFSFSITITF